MNYIVLDMEWNQPFDMKKILTSPVVLHGEIVQIGAVKTDENCNIIDTFKILVNPKYYTKMNKRVAALTNINTKDLQYGFPFPLALSYFKKWCGQDFVFFTWGDSDIEMLHANMVLHGEDESWLPKTYNLQVIYNSQVERDWHGASLASAIEKLGVRALKAHDALNDAQNTVSVCKHMDVAKGIAEYDNLLKEMGNTDNRTVYIKDYTNKFEAFEDPEVIVFNCHSCGENVTCKDFVIQSSDKYICLCKCKNDDEFFVRLRFSRTKNGEFSVIRLIYAATDENREFYKEKKILEETKRMEYLQHLSEEAAGVNEEAN